MNVQELIDELNKLEDKTKAVKYWCHFESCGGYFEINSVEERIREGDEPFIDLTEKIL